MDVGDTPFDARAGSSVGETLSPSVGETLSPSEFNASVRDSALDAIIAAIKAPDGFAEDLHGLAGLCRATWVEEQVWDGLVRVQCGVLRRTHLMYAAWKGDVARVKRLLTPRHARMRPAAQLELADSNGQTALAWAALGGSAITVRFLLGMGARVGTAVLVTAAEGGNVEIFGMLLSGASAALVARMADSAYDRRADVEVAKAWCPQGGITADMIERDVNARGEGGDTLLNRAADFGNTAVTEALLRVGADVNAHKALICAAEKGHTAIVTALLAVPGIEVNAKNSVRLCLSSPFPPALSSTYPPLPTRTYNRHDARVR